MLKSKLAPVFAILLALTLFFGGMLSYKLLAGTGAKPVAVASAAHKSPARPDSLTIQGRVLVLFYHADGTRFATWRGHNALSTFARAAIAGCASGLNTAPDGFGSCSGWVFRIQVAVLNAVGTNFFYGPATNTELPTGCSFAPAAPRCTGWQSVATVDIGTDGTLNAAAALGNTFFDSVVIPGMAVTTGDRAVVTITFTVS